MKSKLTGSTLTGVPGAGHGTWMAWNRGRSSMAGGSIMIWGCMTVHSPGFMCKLNRTMDRHVYKDILKEELAATIEYYDMDPSKVIFQHDNDPKHTAKSVREW